LFFIFINLFSFPITVFFLLIFYFHPFYFLKEKILKFWREKLRNLLDKKESFFCARHLHNLGISIVFGLGGKTKEELLVCGVDGGSKSFKTFWLRGVGG